MGHDHKETEEVGDICFEGEGHEEGDGAPDEVVREE
jgi:hypothetical protein